MPLGITHDADNFMRVSGTPREGFGSSFDNKNSQPYSFQGMMPTSNIQAQLQDNLQKQRLGQSVQSTPTATSTRSSSGGGVVGGGSSVDAKVNSIKQNFDRQMKEIQQSHAQQLQELQAQAQQREQQAQARWQQEQQQMQGMWQQQIDSQRQAQEQAMAQQREQFEAYAQEQERIRQEEIARREAEEAERQRIEEEERLTAERQGRYQDELKSSFIGSGAFGERSTANPNLDIGSSPQSRYLSQNTGLDSNQGNTGGASDGMNTNDLWKERYERAMGNNKRTGKITGAIGRRLGSGFQQEPIQP